MPEKTDLGEFVEVRLPGGARKRVYRDMVTEKDWNRAVRRERMHAEDDTRSQPEKTTDKLPAGEMFGLNKGGVFSIIHKGEMSDEQFQKLRARAEQDGTLADDELSARIKARSEAEDAETKAKQPKPDKRITYGEPDPDLNTEGQTPGWPVVPQSEGGDGQGGRTMRGGGGLGGMMRQVLTSVLPGAIPAESDSTQQKAGIANAAGAAWDTAKDIGNQMNQPEGKLFGPVGMAAQAGANALGVTQDAVVNAVLQTTGLGPVVNAFRGQEQFAKALDGNQPPSVVARQGVPQSLQPTPGQLQPPEPPSVDPSIQARGMAEARYGADMPEVPAPGVASANLTDLNTEQARLRANRDKLTIEQDDAVKAHTKATDDATAAITERLKKGAELADLQQKATITARDEANRFQTISNAAAQRARDAAMQGLDPSRFWSNQSFGQKAAAIVSGAMFGFIGQGMTYLKRLDDLVNQDVQWQASDRDSRVRGEEGLAKKYESARDHAINMGAKTVEAYQFQKAALWEGIKAQAEVMGMRTTNMQVKQAAAQLMQRADDHIGKITMDKANLLQQSAGDINRTRLSVYEQQQQNRREQMREKSAYEVAMMKSAGAKQGEVIKPAQMSHLQDLTGAVQMAERLEQTYNKKAAGLGASIAQFLPWTDAYEYVKGDFESFVQDLGILRERGVLRKDDIEKYKGMFPLPKDAPDVAEAKIENVKFKFNSDLDNYLTSMETAGQNTTPYRMMQGALRGKARAAQPVEGEVEE